tara:strand:+ start:2685 stop:5969 length:3285 start_codon:yes stop_codon:yes gene_type:complete
MRAIMDETQSTTKTKRRYWRPFLHVLRVMALVAILPVIFAGMAAVLLVERDIDAPGWLASRIETRAAKMLQGGSLVFGNIYINIGRDLHPRVRLVETAISDANGILVARIPTIEGMISPRGLLFEGSVLMQDVALDGAQINLTRARDGTVALAFGDGGLKTAPSFVALLDQSDRLLEQPAFAALRKIRATGLVINYSDVRAGRVWTVDGGLLDLDLTDDQTAVRGDFSVLSGRAGITRMTFEYDSPRGAREARIAVSVDGARASDIASQSQAMRWLADVDAPISVAIRTTLDAQGALGPLSATLALGRGALQPNAATEPVIFDTAKAYLTYEPESQLIRFDQIEVAAPAGRVAATGRAYLGEFVEGVPQALVAQFNFSDSMLAAGGVYEDGLMLPPLSLDMRLRFDPFAIEIGQIAMADGETHVVAEGQVTAASDGWQVAFDASVDQIETARLLELWPAALKPRSRQWVLDNVTGGRLTDARVDIRARQSEKPVIAASYEFSDATVRFMRTMPLMQGAVGIGVLQDNQMILSLDEGRVPAPQGGSVDLAGSTMIILDTRVRGGDAELDLRMDGTITATLALLDREPFRFISKAGQSVTVADGRVEVQGDLRFALRKGVPPSEVQFDIAADLTDVHSDALIKGRDLAASRLRLTADRDGLQIGGPVRLDGIAAKGTWTQPFGAQAAGRSRVVSEVTLSQQFLDAFGIALPPGTVSGLGQADLAIDLVKGQAPAFRLTSDLRGIGVGLPALGWRKAANATGALTVVGALGPVPRVDVLEVSGGGLQAKGAIRLTAQGALEEARFSQVSIGNWLNAPVTISGRGKGRPVAVSIAGGTLDLRGAAFGGGNGETGPMNLRLDKLQISEGIALDDFRGDFSGLGGLSGEFSGNVNGGPEISGTVAPQNGRSAVRLQSADAGGVVGAAGFVKNGVGGALDLTMRPVGAAGTFDGVLSVRDLRVRDAPSIAALLDAISVVGLLRQLDGEGLAFDEVDAKFRLTPTEVIVTEASAVGPGLGISLDGIYTLASKQIDFQGVVSPFYLLNSIGSFLTRKGEGLIGFNFNLAGNAANPDVSVNPLSALTPGMFREIFRRPVPEVTQ